MAQYRVHEKDGGDQLAGSKTTLKGCGSGQMEEARAATVFANGYRGSYLFRSTRDQA